LEGKWAMASRKWVWTSKMKIHRHKVGLRFANKKRGINSVIWGYR
jgi:hypothetical protein